MKTLTLGLVVMSNSEPSLLLLELQPVCEETGPSTAASAANLSGFAHLKSFLRKHL